MIDYRAIKELIATEDKWTTEVYARDKDGVPVWYDDARAVRFCLAGAAKRCGYSPDDLYEFTGANVVGVNDYGGFRAVHRLLDHMIAKQESAQ